MTRVDNRHESDKIVSDSEPRKTFKMLRLLQVVIFRNGVWVPWIISPVAPPGEQKIRVIVSAQHTEDDIERALDHFKDAKKFLK